MATLFERKKGRKFWRKERKKERNIYNAVIDKSNTVTNIKCSIDTIQS